MSRKKVAGYVLLFAKTRKPPLQHVEQLTITGGKKKTPTEVISQLTI